MAFRSVDARFWTDPKVRSLPFEVKALFLYFITAPVAHYSGLYYLPLPMVLYETGMSEKTLKNAMDLLEKNGMVLFDEMASTVFVVNMAKFQVLNGSMVMALKRHFTENIQSKSMIAAFFEKYPDLVEKVGLGVDMMTHLNDQGAPQGVPQGGGEGVPQGAGISIRERIRIREREREEENVRSPKGGPLGGGGVHSKQKRYHVTCPADIEPTIFAEFLLVCDKKVKPFTERVLKTTRDEAAVAGITITEALAWCVDHGYARFEAEWYRKDPPRKSTPSSMDAQAEEERARKEKAALVARWNKEHGYTAEGG